MRTKHLYLALLLALLLYACGTAKRGEPTYAPVPTDTAALAQGEAVYMANCQKCHPGGEAGLGPAINNKPAPGFGIRFQIRHGLGVMPAFKKDRISAGEMDQLMAYIKTLRKAREEPLN